LPSAENVPVKRWENSNGEKSAFVRSIFQVAPSKVIS
jgi:hypothetical protein